MGTRHMARTAGRHGFAHSCHWALFRSTPLMRQRAGCGCTTLLSESDTQRAEAAPLCTTLHSPRRWSGHRRQRRAVSGTVGWHHTPEGHRAGSRPRDAREHEQLSRSSEPSVHRLDAVSGPVRGGRLRQTTHSGERPTPRLLRGWSRFARAQEPHQQTSSVSLAWFWFRTLL